MNRIGRREFLGGVVATTAVLRSAVAQAAEPEKKPVDAPVGKPDVVEVSGSDRKAMVKAALAALGGIEAFVSRGQRVVLKPNLAFANPAGWATTTHPDTLVAVAQACLSAGAKEVLVVEYALADWKKCFERTGAQEALRALPEVKVQFLSERDEFREVAIPDGLTLKSTEIARAILEADVFINLPQAKHHGSAGVSFGLKNAMGAIWSRKPLHVAHNLQEAIADLGRVVKPHLTILDGTHVLLSGGPRGPGDLATPGKMVAGRAIASVDAWGLGIAQFGGKTMQPADARHIVLAAQAGLGEHDVRKLKVAKVAT